MDNLLGWLFLLIIFSFILVWSKKYPYAKNFLLLAFFLRATCVVLHQYDLITLPDSQSDAQKFEGLARDFSRNSGLSVVFSFFNTDSFLISRIISIFYTIFVESKFIAQGISVALGTASVYLVYHLSLILWDHNSAKKAAWVMAIFPSIVLYSSLILREVYVVFFLLIALIGIVKFFENKNITSLLQVVFSFYILMFFHGPTSIGGIIFLSYLSLGLIRKQINKFYKLKFNILSISLICILLIPLGLFLNNNITIPYLPSPETLLNLEYFKIRTNLGINDTAAYPSWLVINNNYEFFTKIIFRIFYFLYSPFVWDIKNISHVIGLIDGMFYFVLTIYVLRNWRTVWANPITRFLIILFISYTIIYGLGVGNFGTGIRHRSKFVMMLIVLAAPKIHKLIFSGKKKLYKR